jgi:hypothetical protein
MPVVTVEQMSFEELVQTLAMFEQEHEPSDVDRAIHRAAVERRLLAILSAGNAAAERRAAVRVPGDLAVRLVIGGEELRATVRDLSEGGLGIRSLLAPPQGATVDIELTPKRASSLLHPPRAQAQVSWVRPVSDHGYDLGLAFLGHDDAHRRRMRRLVVELLRRLPTPLH